MAPIRQRTGVVEHSLLEIRPGIVRRQQDDSIGVESRRRYSVILESLVRQRVLDGAHAIEVACKHSVGGNDGGLRRAGPDYPLLVREKEEQLVLYDAASDRTAAVVVAVLGLDCGKEIARGQLVIAEE